jgi:hypothetical protein
MNTNGISLYSMSASSSYQTSATITGFELFDPDQGVDLIKVSVETSIFGRVTLNPQLIKYLDFNSASFCYGETSWHCVGDGTSENRMVFVAAPSIVQSALNGLIYQCTNSGITDNITITLFDGVVRFFDNLCDS